MNYKRILITGGAGFIGSHIADKLLNMGISVVIIDNESTGLLSNVPSGADYYFGDVRKPNDIAAVFETGINAVIHMAGQASNIHSFIKPEDDLSTNVLGTLNIIQACIEHKVSRLLYASSMTVYGHPNKLPITEEHPTQPMSYYGITKYAAERYVLATSCRSDLPHRFNVTAFRMFNVYGERQRLDNPYQGALGFFLGNILRDEEITIHSDGEQTRDFVYIGDVVNAWVNSLDNSKTFQQVLNIGSGKSVSINQLVDTLLKITRHNRQDYPIQYAPVRPGDQRHMVAEISKAATLMNWTPKIDLKEGLSHTYSWAKTQLRIRNG